MSEEIQYNGKYLDLAGLQALWDKINLLFPRTENLSTILDSLDNPYIHSDQYNTDINSVRESIKDIQATGGFDPDDDTIIYGNNGWETNLILDIDGNNLRLVTKGNKTEISKIDLREIIGESVVKDGMLDSASVVVIPGDEEETDGRQAGTYIKFVFNTDAGKEPIYLNVSEFVNILAGDDYITINNNQISVNLVKLEEYISSSVTITNIQSRLDEHDTLLQNLSTTVSGYDTIITNIQDEFAILKTDVESYNGRITSIENVIENVPMIPITEDEITSLE